MSNHETSGIYSFGALSLLATGNPDYADRVRDEAHALLPDAATRAQMMSDQRDATYYDFRMSTPALLVYALPLRHPHITGRIHIRHHHLGPRRRRHHG